MCVGGGGAGKGGGGGVKGVSNGTSPPQGQQVCQIILKSIHNCRNYDPDKADGRTHPRTITHIHLSKKVTAMSHFTASGLMFIF